MYTHKYDRSTNTWFIKNPKGRTIATGMTWRVARSFAQAKNAERTQSMNCQYNASQLNAA